MVSRGRQLALLLLLAGCSAREGTVLIATRDAAGLATASDAGLVDAARELDAAQSADGGASVFPVVDAASADTGTSETRTGVSGVCRITGAPDGFYENFDGTALSDTWLLAHGVHSFAGSTARGGFVRDNVALQNGTLLLMVRGDKYNGPVRGINADGSARSDGRRSAAAAVTRDLFASGTYQMQGHLVAPAGVEVALWVMADDDSSGGIDIAVPGLALDAGTPSYAAVRMRSRTSRDASALALNQFALTDSLDDGKSHILRFDWYTVRSPATQFWLDDSPRWTASEHVPSGAARRLWIVAWIPDDVAADFETANVRIDNVFITPFGNDGDRCAVSTFRNPGLVAP